MTENPLPARDRPFALSREGYVRHWLIVGPAESRYQGDAGTEQAVRAEVIDPAIIAPPAEAAMGQPGPLGAAWRFYQPGRNLFVELSGFYHNLTRLEMIAATDVLAESDARLACRLWTPNTVDVWCNGRHLLRYTGTLFRKPDVTSGFLPLRPGRNRIVVRVQELAGRECPFLFGLQAMEATAGLSVMLPGGPETTRAMREADTWFAGLRADGRRAVQAPGPPSFDAAVALGEGDGGAHHSAAWPAGKQRFEWDRAGIFSVDVSAEVMGQRLVRGLELPANRAILDGPARTGEEHRRAFVEAIAHAEAPVRRPDLMSVLARHVLGRPDAERDEAALGEVLDWIDGRPDCADFALAAAIRFHALGFGTGPQRERIRRTMLAFRYWQDEPGSDAMCFGSENHSLLFHGCQYVAGLLLPDERFTNTGRTGRQQAEIGKARCEGWLAERERVGYTEFLSTTYFPITVAALMNLVDFADDEALSRRAAAQVDAIFEMLARHSFDGVTVGPQGRVYRGILYPHTSAAQALLYYAAPRAVPASNGWPVFVASSPKYQPPADLHRLLHAGLETACRQADVRIHLLKTPRYMLSSLEIPCVFADEPPGPRGLEAGQPGYQQHLWHATLGRDCHVFVNHPGASFDLSQARPGFWYGNGVLPRLAQEGASLMAIYSIPPTHPIQFTHAHWPADALDRREQRGLWHFGAKGEAYIGLWCSLPTRRASDVLTDRELRADGPRVAWLCRCSDVTECGDFDSFISSCGGMSPIFNPNTLTLSAAGEEP